MSRDRARELRKNLTDTERFVWDKLRHRQLGGHKFRRQVSLGPYIADLVCLERRLIVELDGGQHAEREEEDARRTQWLEGQGFTVIRFWNHEALQEWDAIEQAIWEHLAGRTPHPNPPPQGAFRGRYGSG
jgi:very-short-patch-repair endonuclease